MVQMSFCTTTEPHYHLKTITNKIFHFHNYMSWQRGNQLANKNVCIIMGSVAAFSVSGSTETEEFTFHPGVQFEASHTFKSSLPVSLKRVDVLVPNRSLNRRRPSVIQRWRSSSVGAFLVLQDRIWGQRVKLIIGHRFSTDFHCFFKTQTHPSCWRGSTENTGNKNMLRMFTCETQVRVMM